MIYGIAIGLVIGFLVGRFVFRTAKDKVYGYLRVDHSDPSDPPLLFLELRTSVEAVAKQKEVRFKVKVEDFLPHN